MSFFDWLVPRLNNEHLERERRFEAHFAEEQSRRVRVEAELARERDRADKAEARAEAAEAELKVLVAAEDRKTGALMRVDTAWTAFQREMRAVFEGELDAEYGEADA